MAEYTDEFVRESREQLSELNAGLLELEDDPDAEEAIDAVFRVAHTMKGNLRAMGYDDAGDVAHALEDVLDAVRDDEVDVTPELMDEAFAAVDALEAIVDDIADDGAPATETSGVVDRLRRVAGGEEASGGAALDLPDGVPDRVVEVLDGDARDNVYRAEVRLDDPEMPGVDALLVVREARERFDRMATHPEEDALEGGAFGERFLVYVDSADSGSAVADHLEGIPQVADATVTEVTEDLETSEEVEEDDVGEVGEVESLRVDVDRVDELYNQVEKLVTNRIKLQRVIEEHGVGEAEDLLYELEKIATSFQDTVLEIRLIPLREVVGNFPRLVRDVARSEGKQVEFTMEGTDIEIDRRILNEIGDPLVHLIKNAIAHGIEEMDERERLGKPIEGRVRLTAERERDTVTISVSDDGRGLDPDRIRERAVADGLVDADEAEAMAEEDVLALVFEPGFSTQDDVSDVSGRGVGMDAVKTAVERVDGEVAVESTVGEGTTVAMTLPISVAIETVLFLETGDETYGLPVKAVDEIATVDDVDLDAVEGREAVTHDGDVYPVIDLGEALDVPGSAADGGGMIVRLREEERPVALRCDGVSGQEEVVVKPFEGVLSGVPGASGASVLGEGEMIVILDVSTL